MQQRRHAGLTTRLLAVVAFLATAIGVMAVTALPAQAAGTWQNPGGAGGWTFANVDGALVLAGTGDDPGLFPATAPRECNNGTNDDVNSGDASKPGSYQDVNADQGSTPKDAECGSIDDTSEVQTGVQNPSVLALKATVAAGGAITVANPATDLVFPTIYRFARQTNVPVLGTLPSPITVTVNPSAVSGNADPATGSTQVAITATVKFSLKTGSILQDPVDCTTGAFTINLTSGTSGAKTGTPYSATTGLTELVDNVFVVPAATGGGLLGGTLCPILGTSLGLPSQVGSSLLRMRMRALPTASPIPQPTVTGVTGLPGSVTEGQTLSLTPTATDSTNVSLCASPCTPAVPQPSWNWRWTQTAGPAGGEIANSKRLTTPIVAGDLGILNDVDKATGTAKILVPKPGAYSFRVDAGNGGATTYGTSFTVSFTATAVTPTVNAGPDLTASANQAAATNAVKLTQTTTSPAPADATGRTYTWTKAGSSTCAGGDLTFTNAAAQNTTFATGNPAADCFVDAVATTTVNGKNATDTVRVNVKATTAGQIKGTVTACTASCVPLATGTAFAFTQPGNTPVLAGAIVGGNYTITGATGGTAYKLYFTGPGVTPTWLGGVTSSGNTTAVVAPYAGANATLYGGASANGTLSATVNVLPSGLAPNGTSVRLYNNAGQYVAKGATVSGVVNFVGLPTGQYKVQFASGSATYASRWADTGLNVSTATPKTVTTGSTTNVSTTLTLLNNATADFQFNSDGGAVSASTTTTITDSAKAWTAGQWVGFKAYKYGGISQTAGTNTDIRTITANTATQFTVSAAFTAAPAVPSAYEILPARFIGKATGGAANSVTDTGQAWAVNSLTGYQVKTLFGTGAGQTRTIASNTATAITTTTNWTTNPDNTTGYQVIPLKADQPGVLGGLATVATTGAAAATNVSTEARVYDAATGAFVAKTVLTTGPSAPLGTFANFSFIKWTADAAAPNAQNGLPNGNYKVLVRIIGTGGGTPAFCSQWMPSGYKTGSGGPAQGGWVNAGSFTVAAGTFTSAGTAPLVQNAACQATN